MVSTSSVFHFQFICSTIKRNSKEFLKKMNHNSLCTKMNITVLIFKPEMTPKKMGRRRKIVTDNVKVLQHECKKIKEKHVM